MASPITTFTAILFITSAAIFTLSLMYVHNLKNKINYRDDMSDSYEVNYDNMGNMGNMGNIRIIEDKDRVRFISKCNKVNQELENLLSNQLVAVDNNHKRLLMEKKQYIKSIKDIVNDLTFNNRQHFEQLHVILKEINKDVEGQNRRLAALEHKVSKGDAMKNELANMLIQRMVNDSSKKALKSSKLKNILEGESGGDKEEELKTLEKYIIKTIRKQLKQEIGKNVKDLQQVQPMNPYLNNELERKLELMDLVNHKLRTMENLYRNLHSPNKKQIITVIKEPVKKSVIPYVAPPKVEEVDIQVKKVKKLPRCPTKNKKGTLKLNKKQDEANTYYVTDDEE
jgi:hypothetical protein